MSRPKKPRGIVARFLAGGDISFMVGYDRGGRRYLSAEAAIRRALKTARKENEELRGAMLEMSRCPCGCMAGEQ